MTQSDIPQKKVHQGRNIKRFREMLGIKQEALAAELGEDWNQKKVSLLEQKEAVEMDILAQIAQILHVPIEAIQNFDEESAINIIANTFNNHDQSTPQFANIIHNSPTFNPLDKLVELYERMLQQQQEMIDKLERLIKDK